MWQIKNKHTHEVFRVFDTRDEFDLQPTQLVTAGCIFCSVGSTTHYAEEAPDTPEMLAAKAKAARRAAILTALSDIDTRSIRPLLEGDTDRVAALAQQAQALRDELKTL